MGRFKGWIGGSGGSTGGSSGGSGSSGSSGSSGGAGAELVVAIPIGEHFVHGGPGVDKLVVDYSKEPASYYSVSEIHSTGGSFEGGIAGGSQVISFDNIERLQLKLDNGDSLFSIEASALGKGAQVIVDAGGGVDCLEADFSLLGAINFTLGFNGVVKVLGSTFSNFESFWLTLGEGNDVVKLGNGDDTVVANGGNDSVDTGGGNDSIFGGEGNDTLKGGAGDDTLYGDSGNDNLQGGAGDDSLYAGDGNDNVQGGDGADVVLAGSGDDVVSGGNGDDSLWGEGGTNSLSGGNGNDVLVSSGIDNVNGGIGYDYWQGDYRFAAGNLTFTYNGSTGSLSNGTKLASIEAVALFTSGGNDTFTIQGARPTPEGGAGVIIFAGAGEDTLKLNLANGAVGTDFIAISLDGTSFGGAAGATSFSQIEEASFTGEQGDRASFSVSQAGFPPTGDISLIVQPNGTLTTNIGVTLLNYKTFQLQSGDGNDTLVASAGNDTIWAMGGNDSIVGGPGGDALHGGAGADQFVFNAIGDFGTGSNDVIYDFAAGEGDKIDVQNVIAGQFAFIGGGAFSGNGDGELRTQDLGGGLNYVEGDADGNGVADFSLLVYASGNLSGLDFLL